jgi:hypothetical protein
MKGSQLLSEGFAPTQIFANMTTCRVSPFYYGVFLILMRVTHQIMAPEIIESTPPAAPPLLVFVGVLVTIPIMVIVTPNTIAMIPANIPMRDSIFLAFDRGRRLLLMRAIKKIIRPKNIKNPPNPTFITIPSFGEKKPKTPKKMKRTPMIIPIIESTLLTTESFFWMSDG